MELPPLTQKERAQLTHDLDNCMAELQQMLSPVDNDSLAALAKECVRSADNRPGNNWDRIPKKWKAAVLAHTLSIELARRILEEG